MTADWDERVAAFWSSADGTDPDHAMQQMRALVEERAPADGRALYEWASVHDFLGFGAAAIPIYRAALAAGLDTEHEAQAVVQLASSLRNVGQPHAAVDLLRSASVSTVTGAAPEAFLALALHDAGQPTEALRVALLALAPTLPLYARSVTAYASELEARHDVVRPCS